jgi:hypothetical protein
VRRERRASSGATAASDASVLEHSRSGTDADSIRLPQAAGIADPGIVGKKLVFRPYREEKLGLQRRSKARRMVSEQSRQKAQVERPNQVWGVDFCLPSSAFLICSTESDPEFVEAAFEIGALGYVLEARLLLI